MKYAQVLLIGFAGLFVGCTIALACVGAVKVYQWKQIIEVADPLMRRVINSDYEQD